MISASGTRTGSPEAGRYHRRRIAQRGHRRLGRFHPHHRQHLRARGRARPAHAHHRQHARPADDGAGAAQGRRRRRTLRSPGAARRAGEDFPRQDHRRRRHLHQSDALVQLVAKKAGLDPEKDIRVAPMPAPNMPAAMAAKSIDGFSSSLPWTIGEVAEGKAVMLASGRAATCRSCCPSPIRLS